MIIKTPEFIQHHIDNIIYKMTSSLIDRHEYKFFLWVYKNHPRMSNIFIYNKRHSITKFIINADKFKFFDWLGENYSHEVWSIGFHHDARITPPKSNPKGLPGYPKCVDNSHDVSTMVASPSGEMHWIKENPELALKNLGPHALAKVEKEAELRGRSRWTN